MSDLARIKILSMKLYFKYRAGSITLEEYLVKIKPLDEKIDFLEVQTFKYCLLDNPFFEKSSSLQPH